MQLTNASRPGGLRSLYVTVALALVSMPAHTAQAGDYHLDLEVGTDVPISVGLTLSLQVPYGIRVSTGVGVMPGTYVDLINEVVTSAGGYSDLTAAIVEETLQNSLVWRTHIGWIADFGLYVDFGYSLAALGGGTSAEAILAAATGTSLSTPGAEREYDVRSALHMLDLEVGWKGVFGDALVVRAAIGFAGTVSSSTRVEQQFTVNGPIAQRAVDELEQAAADYLDDTYQSYVFTPVITVSLGYRFF